MIWKTGCDQWGGAVFSETRTDPATLAKMPQTFLRFRNDFTAVAGEPLVFDLSADERFVLLLDGEEIARGPNRGLRNRWHYQSYRVADLTPGAHRLEAVCWQIGEHAPLAQVSLRRCLHLRRTSQRTLHDALVAVRTLVQADDQDGFCAVETRARCAGGDALSGVPPGDLRVR